MKKEQLKIEATKQIANINEVYQNRLNLFKDKDEIDYRTKPKNKLDSTYLIAFEQDVDISKFNDKEQVKTLKQSSNAWRLDFFDEQSIRTILENSNLGFTKKDLVFLGKTKKIDLQKSLEQLEKEELIIVFHNPEAVKKAKQIKPKK